MAMMRNDAIGSNVNKLILCTFITRKLWNVTVFIYFKLYGFDH